MTELEKAAREYSKGYPSTVYNYGMCTVVPSCTARNSFAAGAEWQAKQSPWINVKEQLPEKDGLRVWVKSNCLNEQPLVYHQGKFYARLSDGCYDDSVTHWMPIPTI